MMYILVIDYVICEKMMSTKQNFKNGRPRGPLPPCPRKDVIQVMQFQYYDNGAKPGRGKVQHTVTLEAYCEGRLNLHKPYWVRTVQLIDPKKVMAWADQKLAECYLTAEQHAFYIQMQEVADSLAEGPDVEFAKMGHIEDRTTKIRYPAQFVLMVRERGGPMQCHVVINGDVISTETFIHDQHSVPGSGRRKAYAFYDPSDMYGAMKREQAMRAEAKARAGESE